MHTRQLRNGDKISLLNPLRKTANDPKGGPVCTSFIFLFTGQNATASLLHGTSSSTVGTNGHASNDKSQSFNRCLHDHYVVKEKIGSGTSGEVMRGLHLASGREVAIKIIPTRQFKLTLPGLTTEVRFVIILVSLVVYCDIAFAC
jgi:serine/threonine protein kinase